MVKAERVRARLDAAHEETLPPRRDAHVAERRPDRRLCARAVHERDLDPAARIRVAAAVHAPAREERQLVVAVRRERDRVLHDAALLERHHDVSLEGIVGPAKVLRAAVDHPVSVFAQARQIEEVQVAVFAGDDRPMVRRRPERAKPHRTGSRPFLHVRVRHRRVDIPRDGGDALPDGRRRGEDQFARARNGKRLDRLGQRRHAHGNVRREIQVRLAGGGLRRVGRVREAEPVVEIARDRVGVARVQGQLRLARDERGGRLHARRPRKRLRHRIGLRTPRLRKAQRTRARHRLRGVVRHRHLRTPRRAHLDRRPRHRRRPLPQQVVRHLLALQRREAVRKGDDLAERVAAAPEVRRPPHVAVVEEVPEVSRDVPRVPFVDVGARLRRRRRLVEHRAVQQGPSLEEARMRRVG